MNAHIVHKIFGQMQHPVKGMIMSKDYLRQYAAECVEKLSYYDKDLETNMLIVSDLSSNILDEFAALITANNATLSNEALGPDNQHWHTKMLPSFIEYLRSPESKEANQHFNSTWRDCVTAYYTDTIQAYLDDALEIHNKYAFNPHSSYASDMPSYHFSY